MAEKVFGKENREFKRIKINLSVFFRVARPAAISLLISNKEVRGTMLDLSEGGISILTNYDIPKATALMIKFTLFKVDCSDVCFYGPMEIEGRVTYCLKLARNEYRVGICFKKIRKQDKADISNFIQMKSSAFFPSL
jgi:c-di-GMP-binding flagellar brake protein YcgR